MTTYVSRNAYSHHIHPPSPFAWTPRYRRPRHYLSDLVAEAILAVGLFAGWLAVVGLVAK